MQHTPKAEKKSSKVAKKPATKKAAPKAAARKGTTQRKEERDATAVTQIIPNIAEIVAKMDKSQPPN